MTEAPRPRPVPSEEPLSPTQELEALRRKLAKRRDEPGFAANVRAIEARIAELEEAQDVDPQ